ncbi:MAG: TIGR02996 domain-containing protein [Myxococcales bacterium]|nr:TIGR02996 domain-containing protein [Myxococcales bacterium]
MTTKTKSASRSATRPEVNVDVDVALLAQLVELWAATRSPRVAALVELVDERLRVRGALAPQIAHAPKRSRARDAAQKAWIACAEKKRPEDLRELLSTLEQATAKHALARLEHLSAHDDPRVAGHLVDLLYSAPWRAKPAKPIYTLALQLIVKRRDARQLPRLEALRFVERVPTSVGQWVQRRIDETLDALREGLEQSPPRPLAAKQAALCAALEAELAPEIRAHERRQQQRRSFEARAAELLAAIYADPRDDQPRQVYADLLSSEGDPRGELIALQLARAGDRGNRSDEAQRTREVELLYAHGERWTEGLATVARQWIFERGFLCDMQVGGNLDALPALAGHRGWGTVQRIDIFSGDEHAERVLASARGSLRVLDSCWAPSLAGFVERGLLDGVTHLGVNASIDIDETARGVSAWSARAAAPQAIALTLDDRERPDIEQLRELADRDALERVDSLALRLSGWSRQLRAERTLSLSAWLAEMPDHIERVRFSLDIRATTLHVTVARDETRRFCRARAACEVGAGPRAPDFDSAAVLAHIRSLGSAPVSLEIEARRFFVVGRRLMFAAPSETQLAALSQHVERITLLEGLAFYDELGALHRA